MSGNDLQLTFGADASGAVQGVNQLKAALGDLGPKIESLNRTLGDLGEKLKGGFSGFGALATGLRAAGETGANAMNQLVATTDDASRRIEAGFKSWIDPLVSSFTKGLMQMAEGTKSFAQVMRSIGQSILDDLVKVVDKMVQQWLWGEVSKRIATQTSVAATVAAQQAGASQGVLINAQANLKKIASDAAAAAAGAYKAMSGIPPAPLWGVLAAGTAYAGVMAFEGLASAARGFDVPMGLNPLTQLHAEEMVLPARLANPMRDMLANFSAANQNGPPAAGGGDTHNHYYSIHAMDGQSFRGFLRGNRDHLSTVLQEMGRAGMRTA